MSDRTTITQVLVHATAGDAEARASLYHAVYAELRRMADIHLARERADHTLQPTELVHEAYLRLIDRTHAEWKDRAHFLAVASHAMRCILVDHARTRGRQKRGGGWQRVPLDQAFALGSEDAHTLVLDLDRALDKLTAAEPEKARVVEMRLFGGLTHDECADILGISARSVARYWDYAQAWLYREMTADGSSA